MKKTFFIYFLFLFFSFFSNKVFAVSVSDDCSGIEYTLTPKSPLPNSTVTVNIRRPTKPKYSCKGNWQDVGLLLDGVPQSVHLCYSNKSMCENGYHAFINSGKPGAHALIFTLNNRTCYCNKFIFITLNPTPTPRRTPTPTPTPTRIPEWNITVMPVCKTPSKILKSSTKLRMFRILWPWVNPATGVYSHLDFNCVYDSKEGNSSMRHSMHIRGENPLNSVQNIYVGLELPFRDNKEAKCSEGIAFEPYEIEPYVPNICNHIPESGDFICFGKYFKPYNYMAEWRYDRLKSGSYTIKVKIPDEYCQDSLTLTPTPCSTKSKGDANCDGKIDGIDYSMWLNRQCSKDNCSDDQLRADFTEDGIVDEGDYKRWFDSRYYIIIWG